MIDSMNPRILASNIRELFKKINSITPGTEVEGNPSGSGYNTLLTKIKIGTHKYKLPTDVEANPEGLATGELKKLGIGGYIYGVNASIDYSGTETLTGRLWLDGSPEYEKTIVLSNSLTLAGNTFTEVPGVNFDNIKTFTDVTLLKNDGACLKAAGAVIDEGKLKVIQTRSSSQVVDIIVIRYVYNTES